MFSNRDDALEIVNIFFDNLTFVLVNAYNFVMEYYSFHNVLKYFSKFSFSCEVLRSIINWSKIN